MLTQTAIDIAVEEIFVNIANYAYGEETGTVVIQVTMHEDPPSAEITFIDTGVQYDPLANPEQMAQLAADDCGVQFSHSLEEQIGGQLRCGFRLLDVYEDTNGVGFLHEHGVPCFWASLSVKE